MKTYFTLLVSVLYLYPGFAQDMGRMVDDATQARLNQYANMLLDNSSQAGLTSDERSKAYEILYSNLLNDHLSPDQERQLYTHIIQRTVKNDWDRALKGLVLYLFINAPDDNDAPPAFQLSRHDAIASTWDGIIKLIPALDPSRGNELSEEEQHILLYESIDDMRKDGIPIDSYINAFPDDR